MSRTRADLRREVLEILGVLASGQDVEAEDADTIDSRITSVLPMLSALGVVYVGDEEEFDDEYFLPIAQIVAEKTCVPFGIVGGRKQEIERDANKARFELRRMTAAVPSSEPVRSEYY